MLPIEESLRSLALKKAIGKGDRPTEFGIGRGHSMADSCLSSENQIENPDNPHSHHML